MSRIIVKNLPQKITKEQVASHFSRVGQVTDVNLKYKQSGKFRGFAFIGFESEEVASEAIKQFCNTYFNKNKIVVEKCLDLGHEEREKEAKKNEKKEISSNAAKNIKDFKYALKMKSEMKKDKLDILMQNPNFIQYLKVNKNGTADLVDALKKKYGTLKDEKNKDLEEEDDDKDKREKDIENKSENAEEPKQESLANRNISDLEYLHSLMRASTEKVDQEKEKKAKKWKELFTVVVRTKEQQTNKEKKGKTFTKKGIKDFFRPLTIHSLRIPRKVSFVAYVGFKSERTMNRALEKDKSYLDGVRVRIHKYEARDTSGNISNKEELPWKAAEDKVLKEANPVCDSGKLFVRNLWYSVTENDLKELFERIGPLTDVTLPISALTRRPKGFAHLTYIFPEHAVKAMNELDGKSFKGRILHIIPSLSKEENEDDLEEKSFKEKRKIEQKKNASSGHNWNSLFIGSEAVYNLLSEKQAKSKYEIMEDEDGSSAAVAMAVSETQIVEETKNLLEENGVCLEVFSKPNVQRSCTVILAKNLPAKTSAAELKELFSRYGELGRLVLPPTGVTAIVEFLNPSEAKRAFRELAYSRFKYLPLYLEWAPFEVFRTPATKKSPEKEDIKKDESTEIEKAEERIREDDTTLYVKNLNFKTDEETLRNHFIKIGDVCSVMIAKRRTLSQGYGFVQFYKNSDANQAFRKLQNTILDGHALSIKKSEKKLVAPNSKILGQSPGAGEQTSAKIIIKNIPFQATYKEVKDLFETAGQVKLLRLPNKLSSSDHRGFGFIEFMTLEQAKKAMASLGASTHLYGRRLVLEWANQDETVEQLRAKTAERFLSSGPSRKKLKMDETKSLNLMEDGNQS